MRPALRFLSAVLVLILALNGRVSAFSGRCATVGPTGDVTVTWDRAGLNAADFRAWFLYYAPGINGPYSLIDSSQVFTDTLQNDPSANAGNAAAYYFISFETNNGSPSIVSDTIRPIGLNVVNPNSGYANLGWNPVHIPLLSTNSPYYRIFREYPAGVFTLIDSLDARTSPVPMTYSDLISICDDTIKYRIEVMDQSGCVSVSPVKGDRFRDLQPPARPEIDSVSVDINGNVIVAWKPSGSLDTRLYQVLQLQGGLWVAIDTVYGRSSTIYNSLVSAVVVSQSFEVIAKDSCNNPSSQSSEHRTIFLETSFEVCGATINMNWNPYTYWNAPVEYEVLLSVNGGTENIIGITANTSFSDTSLISGANFCYRVRAREIGTARSSTSNKSCIVPAFPPLPAFSYLRKVSVVAENQLYICAYVDPSAVVSGYQLERSMDAAGPFTVIATNTVNGTSLVEFYDNVETTSGPYYYRIITLDSCGLISKISNVGRSVIATVTTDDYVNTLNWSTYETWTGGTHHYDIYRSINGVYDPAPAYSLSSFFFGTSHSDPVIDLYISDGEFCYYVEAIEGGGNPFGFSDTVRTNEVCVKVEPLIYIPNAFHPDGEFNKIWNPSNAFVQNEGYQLRVFDRWGKTIFTSDDPKKGWDGTLDGNYLPVGVYIYQLRALTSDGGKITKTGSVTLVE
jgi:gliding motility-associated-like protein